MADLKLRYQIFWGKGYTQKDSHQVFSQQVIQRGCSAIRLAIFIYKNQSKHHMNQAQRQTHRVPYAKMPSP